MSDIKARLKPVEDNKSSKPILEAKKSLDSAIKKPPEISTFKPVLQREPSNLKKPVPSDNKVSAGPIAPSLLSEGPLCPMHAHAKLANQRKVSKDDLKNTNTEHTDKNNSEPESTINKTLTETRKLSEPVYESVKTGLSESRKLSETTDRQRPLNNRKLSETGKEDKQRTPSISSDDNLLSDRSERSERSGTSNEVTTGTMTLGRKKKKAPPPPVAAGTFITRFGSVVIN